MQENIQELYHQKILPLPASEQLKLANMILEKVTGKGANGEKNGPKGSIRELFGKGHHGDPSSADNERIDADLARAYTDTHDHEK